MERKWFRRNWLGFLEYGLGLLIALGIFYVFVTFYDDWLAFSAFATLLLALAAFLAIRHSSEQEKRNRKERLLDEIIEWAEDVAKFLGGWKVASLVRMSGEEDKLFAHITDFETTLNTLKIRSTYISKIAKVLGTILHTAVKKAIDDLDEHSRLYDEWHNNKVSQEQVIIQKSLFNISVSEVIKEAVKLKTRDIGREGEDNMSKEGEATVSKEPTLKDIDDHLNQQDKKLENGKYFSGYLFGATMIFIAFSLLAGKYILTTELGYASYAIVLLIGGTGMMLFTWHKRRKPTA